MTRQSRACGIVHWSIWHSFLFCCDRVAQDKHWHEIRRRERILFIVRRETWPNRLPCKTDASPGLPRPPCSTLDDCVWSSLRRNSSLDLRRLSRRRQATQSIEEQACQYLLGHAPDALIGIGILPDRQLPTLAERIIISSTLVLWRVVYAWFWCMAMYCGVTYTLAWPYY